MKIVAVVGSPRMNGNTSYLTDQALAEARKLDAETEKVMLTQYHINPCQGHDDCGDLASCPQKDDTEFIVRKLYDADGIILSSPVYYYNVTAQLKAFIDRNRFYRRHGWKMKAKGVGIIVIAGGGGIEDTNNALMNFITLSSNIVAEKVLKAHGFARTQGEIKSNTAIVELARTLGKNLAEELLGT